MRAAVSAAALAAAAARAAGTGDEAAESGRPPGAAHRGVFIVAGGGFVAASSTRPQQAPAAALTAAESAAAAAAARVVAAAALAATAGVALLTVALFVAAAATAAVVGATMAVGCGRRSKTFKLDVTFDGSEKIPGWLATSGHASSTTSLIEISIKKLRPSLPFSWCDDVKRINGKARHQPSRCAAHSQASSSILAHLYLLFRCLVVSGLIGAFGELLDAAVSLCVASNLCGWA